MNDREKLIHYAIQYKGDYKKVLEAYTNSKLISPLKEYPNAITLLDEIYPEAFKMLEYPPLVLFYKGDLRLLSKPMISVIGTRIPNGYAEKITIYIVEQLKLKYVIVSGMAKGVDALAHKGALDKYSIGVLGAGIDTVYPACNEQLYKSMAMQQLLISEYPYDTSPQKYYFPWRNRLIAALGKHLVVVQAKIQSGTMHTVNEALKLNKDIYVIPHQIDDQNGCGNNQLIQQGANILLTEDITML